MFPAQVPQTDPGELLKCRDSSPFGGERWQNGDEGAKADAALAQEIDNALWQQPILRALDYNNIEIRVKNGSASLYGHVVTATNGHQVENTARAVKGVLGIKNHLIADDRLATEIANALASLEHTYDCKFFTGVSHGVVILSGTVDDTGTKLLAERIAAGNPNVRGVINSVRVRGGGLDLPDLPLFEPHTGAEFFFLDGRSGRVRQVIINPDNRRVVAMVLQVRFGDQQQELKSSGNGEARTPDRSLVLPMSVVRYLTTASGFLNIRSTQSNQYPEFNSADFQTPEKGWTPPYPYCPADVLFPAKQADALTQNPEQIESPIEVAMAHQVLKDQLLENDSLGG